MPVNAMPATEDDIAYYLNELSKEDVGDRALALRSLAKRPTGDSRVVSAIAPLLSNVEPCLLQLPPLYGELRLLAAAALAAEKAAAGEPASVHVRAVRPLTATLIHRLEDARGIGGPTGQSDPTEAVLTRWRRLRDHGAFVEDELAIPYPAYLSFLSPPE
jgi:hypothetical protein